MYLEFREHELRRNLYYDDVREQYMNEYSKLNALKGIGEKTEKLFQKLNIETVGDLLRYYPRAYEIYEEPVPISEASEGEVVTITGSIYGKVQVVNHRNLQITTAYVRDISGSLKVVWFRMPFLRNTLKSGSVITLRGRIVNKKGTPQMEHPEIFYPSASYDTKRNTMQPVYPLTAGLSNQTMIKAVKQALVYLDLKREFLPEKVRMEYHLAEYNFAVRQIHFPETKQSFYLARERLVFEEFLVFILALRQMKEVSDKQKNTFVLNETQCIDKLIEELPYELTNAQKKVWQEIREDMQGEHVMSRLVQGDVGSGKTIIALFGLLLVGLNGYQGALMAPTEVLAKQHYDSISELLEKYDIPIKTELLTGSMTAKEKREAYERISSGESQIMIGTHALIQDKVEYHSLALVVTDEQHRFGVKQREKFAEKGMVPHILVMSATPIPRTLAMIVYGDLDISVIDELPANRLPIKNCVVDTGYRGTAYHFIQKQVRDGRQCYVICPMVEESEAIEAENVLDYAKNLQEELGSDIRVAHLHGKMKQKEKDEIMEAFGRGEIQVLVSTTVIEVGINVPNATVMMVENAERFGLAQLHQLRGRVGRGKHQSYCIFMSASKTKETKERLEILNKTNDGFKIAREDLRLRGPGDLFGIRQSGILDFKLGDVFQDANVLQNASEAAQKLLREDPKLDLPEHHNLKTYLQFYLKEGLLETTL